MKKKYIIAFILIVIIIGGYFIFKNQVGDIRPALTSSKIDITKILPNANNTPGASKNDFSVGDLPVNITDSNRVSIYAKNLGSPRDLELIDSNNLLVSIPKRGQIMLIPENRIILNNLNNPHGIKLYKNYLYVAEESALLRFNWDSENKTASLDKKLFDLPTGDRHFTRTIEIDNKQNLYISIGSSCDTCFEKHPWLATVVSTDLDGNDPQVYSSGLRNAVFLKKNPDTGSIWTTEMGRDFLGDNLPPDEINVLQKGDYGWPICYGNKVYDSRFNQESPSYCNSTIAPIYNIQAHSAPLGINFLGDYIYVSYHGSWNRSSPVGYKVVRIKYNGDKVVGGEEAVITGFLSGSDAVGRPVDMEFSSELGVMYLTDDKAGVVYKIKL